MLIILSCVQLIDKQINNKIEMKLYNKKYLHNIFDYYFIIIWLFGFYLIIIISFYIWSVVGFHSVGLSESGSKKYAILSGCAIVAMLENGNGT